MSMSVATIPGTDFPVLGSATLDWNGDNTHRLTVRVVCEYGEQERAVVFARELPLGLAEIAELLGIQRRSVDRMKARGSLPEPDGYVSGSPVWWRETIASWNAGRGRRPRAGD